MRRLSFRRHRFPPDIMRHSIWLYARFTLSYRDVEEMLAERGLDVSYETVRRWFLKFGSIIAANLRRPRPRPSDHWHLDEMVIVIQKKRYWLWRAVDNEGEVLDFLVQRRRNAKAARKLMKKLLKKQDRDGQASVIPFGLPSYRPCGRTRSRFEGQQQSRKLSSAGSAAGAQATEVQVTRLGATLPQHPFCDLQHFLSPASSPQTTHVQSAANRIVRRLATREHGGLNLDPNRPNCEIHRLM